MMVSNGRNTQYVLTELIKSVVVKMVQVVESKHN